jgi:hypothetical protein
MARKKSAGATETTAQEEALHHTAESENGKAASADGAAPNSETMQRAEEIVDRLGEQIGQYATAFGRALLRLAARAREEAEDIWAEAQHLRNKES